MGSFKDSARAGCYLFGFLPESGPTEFWGSLRWERLPNGKSRVSGDLYRRPTDPSASPFAGFPRPDPRAGVPVFPRANYTQFWRLSSIEDSAQTQGQATLGFSRLKWSRAAREFFSTPSASVILAPATAPGGFPDPENYFEGSFTNSNQAFRVVMGWVDDHLRRATIELSHEAAVAPPLSDGQSMDWKSMGEKIGWKLEARLGDEGVTGGGSEGWSLAQLHNQLGKSGSQTSLDDEWRYHLLCVSKIRGYDRGVMFDVGMFDQNDVPREGAAIASSWQIPDTAKWNPHKGKPFGSADDLFFRTAVHEWAHACNLNHNSDLTIMTTTDVLAGEATAQKPVSSLVDFRFTPSNERALKHAPDIQVRPGGPVAFAPDPVGDEMDASEPFSLAGSLELSAKPVVDQIPLGAPARIDLALTSLSENSLSVPESIGLKAGFLAGEVRCADYRNTFSSAIRCADHSAQADLGPWESVTNAVTLMRGCNGPLFPRSGYYEIRFTLEWPLGQTPVCVEATTGILVISPSTKRDSKLALELLRNPEAFWVLVVGGEHLGDGIEAIQRALKSKLLRPHFDYIEAKRRSGLVATTTEAAEGFAEMITGTSLLNSRERHKVLDVAGRARPKKNKERIQRLRRLLK